MKRHHQCLLSCFFSRTPKGDEEKNDSEHNAELSVADKEEENEQNEELNACQDPDDDIVSYRRSHLNDNEKMDALSKLKNPPPYFNFPAVVKGSKLRKFSYHWLAEFDWLIYSVTGGGVYCKFCYFFAEIKSDRFSSKRLSAITKSAGKHSLTMQRRCITFGQWKQQKLFTLSPKIRKYPLKDC